MLQVDCWRFYQNCENWPVASSYFQFGHWKGMGYQLREMHGYWNNIGRFAHLHTFRNFHFNRQIPNWHTNWKLPAACKVAIKDQCVCTCTTWCRLTSSKNPKFFRIFPTVPNREATNTGDRLLSPKAECNCSYVSQCMSVRVYNANIVPPRMYTQCGPL